MSIPTCISSGTCNGVPGVLEVESVSSVQSSSQLQKTKFSVGIYLWLALALVMGQNHEHMVRSRRNNGPNVTSRNHKPTKDLRSQGLSK